ncbi:MAG: hypothetical protein ACP5ON_04795 [Bacteroidota bacterium]
MGESLNGQAVKDWLSGQKATADRIALDRARYLLHLTAEAALRTYLELHREFGKDLNSLSPSPLLMAMRRALARIAKGERKS